MTEQTAAAATGNYFRDTRPVELLDAGGFFPRRLAWM
jgi:hypothetical protein